MSTPAAADRAAPLPDDSLMLTIVLKHDQSQNIDKMQGTLAERAWWERFPPEGCEIVSWTVAMGLGQIVTLRLPPRLLNIVNIEIERSAWGVFQTEMYPTYDFVPVRERLGRAWQNATTSKRL